jgi:hypothetical protein
MSNNAPKSRFNCDEGVLKLDLSKVMLDAAGLELLPADGSLYSLPP